MMMTLNCGNNIVAPIQKEAGGNSFIMAVDQMFLMVIAFEF